MVVGVAVATIFSGGTAELAAGIAVSVGFGGLSLDWKQLLEIYRNVLYGSLAKSYS